jgi:hypothetical protein
MQFPRAVPQFQPISIPHQNGVFLLWLYLEHFTMFLLPKCIAARIKIVHDLPKNLEHLSLRLFAGCPLTLEAEFERSPKFQVTVKSSNFWFMAISRASIKSRFMASVSIGGGVLSRRAGCSVNRMLTRFDML